MRAFRLHSLESPPGLTEIPRPDPAPHEVLIRVEACGLNFADLLMMTGQYQERAPLPVTLGLEFAGQIVAVGAQVTTHRPGDRVAAFAGQGGLAEYAVCAAERCVPVPQGMHMHQAAAFLVAYGTSHLALAHRARLVAGETLVVLGAAGGVGLTAVEIGALMGARVIAVARGPEKCAIAQAAGAQVCLDSATLDLRSALRDLGGADVIYPANILLVKNLTVIGLYWGAYLNFAPKALTDSLRCLMTWFDEGRITPHVSHVLPFAQVAEGLEMLRARKSTGKIVVSMSGPE